MDRLLPNWKQRKRVRAFLLSCVPFVVIVTFWLYAILPFWQPGITSRADMLCHLYRLFELDRCWKSAIYYPRIAPDFGFGYGMPFFQFYPPLTSYVAEFFHLVGLGFIEAIKATFSLGLFLSGLGMYLYGLAILREKTGALLAAIAYIYAPYQLLNIYERGALPESFALSLLPFIFWTFHWLYKRGDIRHLLLAAFILGALAPTHNIIALFFTPLLLAYLVFLFLKRPDGHRLFLCLLATILALGLGAFYWLPALLEKGWVAIPHLVTDSFSVREHFASLSTIIQNSLIFDYWGPLRFRLGLTSAIFALLAIGMLALQPRDLCQSMLFFSTGLVICLLLQLSATQRLWEIIPLANFIQFPWRLLGFASVSIALLMGSLPGSVAILVSKLSIKSKIGRSLLSRPELASATVLTLLVILTSTLRLSPGLSPLWSSLTTGEITLFSLSEMGQSGSGASDLFRQFLPIWVDVEVPDIAEGRPRQEGASIVSPAAPVNIEVVEHGAQYFNLRTSSAQLSPLLFHLFYFPGWQAYVDGEKVHTYPSTPLGLVTLALPSGEHKIVLRFEETPIRRASMLLSSLTLCAFLVACIYRWRSGLLLGSSLLLLLIALAAWHIRPFVFTQFPFPAEANFEGKVKLLGYTIDKPVYRPGETLGVTLYWLSLREMGEDYTVFVHLVEENGIRLFGQHDGQPVYNFTPTTRWEPGEIVVDRHEFTIQGDTPPGQYRIFVGIYLLSTMRRLEVLDTKMSLSENAVLLTRVRVQEAAR